MTTGTTVAARLAAFAAEWPPASVPDEVRRKATLHLLDTVGCGLAAVGLAAGEHVTAIAAEQGGRAEASLLGHSAKVPAALAALANGTRCHALDFDDTHEAGICHVSTVVAPAALAVGEARGHGLAEMVDAYVLGCEVALRIAIAAADGLYARGFHPTSVCGAFGAAAAASRLLSLDAPATTQALGVVGSFASGLFEYLSDGSATKPLHAGWAAQAGVQAARLAGAGATGPASVIEGRFGLLASHTGTAGGSGQAGRNADRSDPSEAAHGDGRIGGKAPLDGLCDTLGDVWEIGNVSLKPFPACHFVHASTWAAAGLAREHRLTAEDVAEVVVRIPPEGVPLVLDPLDAKIRPRTAYDAKFSLPFAVAHHLVHGRLDLASFSDDRIHDRDVLALAARVRTEPLSAGEVGASRFAGGARLGTRSGAQLDRFLPHAPGSPANPLDDSWIDAKFRANARLGRLDDADVDTIIAALRARTTPPAPLVPVSREMRDPNGAAPGTGQHPTPARSSDSSGTTLDRVTAALRRCRPTSGATE